jgi:hypothetical protein
MEFETAGLGEYFSSQGLFVKPTPVLNGASMKPSLSRPAVKIVFVLFFVRFYQHRTTTHLFGFGA